MDGDRHHPQFRPGQHHHGEIGAGEGREEFSVPRMRKTEFRSGSPCGSGLVTTAAGRPGHRSGASPARWKRSRQRRFAASAMAGARGVAASLIGSTGSASRKHGAPAASAALTTRTGTSRLSLAAIPASRSGSSSATKGCPSRRASQARTRKLAADAGGVAHGQGEWPHDQMWSARPLDGQSGFLHRLAERRDGRGRCGRRPRRWRRIPSRWQARRSACRHRDPIYERRASGRSSCRRGSSRSRPCRPWPARGHSR